LKLILDRITESYIFETEKKCVEMNNLKSDIKSALEEMISMVAGESAVRKIVSFIGDDSSRFGSLTDLLRIGECRDQVVISWAIGKIAELHPELIPKHHSTFIPFIADKSVHASTRRNLIRVYQYADIPKELEGILYSHCFDSIQEPNEPLALRALSISVCGRIAYAYPELQQELKLLFEAGLKPQSLALTSRMDKLAKKYSWV
jgi:hypothetical protein